MSRIDPVLPQSIPQNLVACGFTTRIGGVSQPPFDSLNLGTRTGDNPQHVAENHRIFYRYAGIHESQVSDMEQVHGGCIRVVCSGGIAPATDGLVTATPEVMLVVRVADCIPLLLYDPVHHIAGVAHCGWRSLAAGIAGTAVRTMIKEAQSRPEDILAVMGPSAGTCCYEVGRETADQLCATSIITRDGRLYADLKRALREQLLETGLEQSTIENISTCTICTGTNYFSHRRDGANAGRMMGYIMVRKQ